MADLVKKLDEQGLKTLISLIKGDNKEIGPEFVSGTLNTNIVHGTGNRLYINDETSGNNNIVSGKNNTVLGVENLVTGLRNTIHKTSQVAQTSGTTTNYIEDAFVNYIPVCNNIVGGSDNVVAHNCNIISGNANYIYGQDNIVNGTSNRVQTIKLNNRSGKYNIVNGTSHFIEGRTGLIIGESNNSYNTSERSIICGQGNTNYGQNNILLGQGNSAQGNNQIVLGTYNVADDNTAIQGDNFAITNKGEFKGTKYFVKNTEAILPLNDSEILNTTIFEITKTRSFNHNFESTPNFNNSVIVSCGSNTIDEIYYNAIVVTGSIFPEIKEEKTYQIIINDSDILKIEKIEPHIIYGENYKLYYKPTSNFPPNINTIDFKNKVNSIRFVTEEYLWQTDIKASEALEQANTYTDSALDTAKQNARIYADNAEKNAKAYSDNKDTANLKEAKAYADAKIESVVILSRNISDGAVTPEKTSFFTKIYGKNLYNRETVSLNKNFNSSGSLIDSTSYFVTDFIPVEANKSITFYRLDRGVYIKSSMRYVVAYDNEQNVISSGIFQNIRTCTIPEGAKFIRASLHNSYYTNHDEFLPMICYGEGDSQPQYEEYKECNSIDVYFKSNNIIDFQDTFDKYFNQKPQIAVVPSACNSYNTTTEFVEFPVNSDLNNVYSLYDGLIESYPDYVSKSLVGNVTVDSTELPIYRYDFTPPLINDSKMTDVCKVLLTNCTHGTEKFQISTTYRFMLDICENWRTSELLRTLRFNCHFTIIPIVNPYGFLNNTRKNENGIDLNRNFETDFIAGTDDTASDYSGTTANSEQSTQIITNLANTEYFDFMLDIHDFGNFSTNGKAGYFASCLKSPDTVGICRAIALWANSKILIENTNIEDINASYFHSTEMSNFNGYLYSAFDNGVLIELMYGWGDDTLGTKETSQKLDVEILGGAILTMLNGYKCRYLNI